MIHHTGEPKSADTVPRSLYLLCFCLSGVQGATSTSKAPGRVEAPATDGCLLLVRSLGVRTEGNHTELGAAVHENLLCVCFEKEVICKLWISESIAPAFIRGDNNTKLSELFIPASSSS